MASNARKKKKPSDSLFPVELSSNSLPSSKADLTRLVAVVSIAAAVAVACNFIATSLNQAPKPFCDTTISGSEDLLSGQVNALQTISLLGLRTSTSRTL